MGTDSKGLFLVDPVTGPVAQYFYNAQDSVATSTKINSIHKYPDNLIVGTGKGLFQLKNGENEFTYIPLGSETKQQDIIETLWDRDGKLWVFSTTEKLLLDENGSIIKSLSFHSPGSHLSENYVNTAFQSKDGLIWHGTNGDGLNICNPLSANFGHLYTNSES